MKWLVLAVGVLLFFNGINSRTYSYENETPARHCFQVDYIGVYGCFGSSAVPTVITWGALLIGTGLIVWSVFRSRRQKA